MKKILKSYNALSNVKISTFFQAYQKKLQLTFTLEGDLNAYLLPKEEKILRANELWKATCFELFLADTESKEYYELNISSSLAWNFYFLKEYRVKPEEVKNLLIPKIKSFRNKDKYEIIFELESAEIDFEKFELFNLATILLTVKKERTFWSFIPQSGVPDFHNRRGFLKRKKES